MLQLITYIKPHGKTALAAIISMLIVVMADLLLPTLMAQIVDQGIASGDLDLIIKTGLLMVGVALLGVAGGIGSTYFASVVAVRFSTDIRTDLFKKVQTLSFDNLDQFKTASLITRLTNDVAQMQNMVMLMLRILIRSPILLVGSLLMAFFINARLALVLLVTVPILALALRYVIGKGFPLFEKVQQGLDQINAVSRENLAGVRVVKAFARADYEKERFGQKNHQLTAVTIKASRTMALIMPLMMLIMNMSILAVLWFGGVQVNTGQIMVGQVIAFTNYMTLILFSLMIAGFMLMMVSRAKVSWDRILEVLKTEVDIQDDVVRDTILDTLWDAPWVSENPIQEGRVDFENVSFYYQGAAGTPVLQNITFSARPGETVAILGATGSGKSTLVNLIPRFYDVSQGRILIDGVDVRQIPLNQVRGKIGLVPQESFLFSGTIRENIRWGRENALDEEIIEAARAAQAHGFISKLPKGYDTALGQRAVNLSGGQKQRLTIARALLKKPTILILDDSTSAVDMQTEALIQKALKNHLAYCTTFVVAQRINTVLEADKILVLEDGQMVALGTHAELIKTCPVYQDIYRSQLGEEAV